LVQRIQPRTAGTFTLKDTGWATRTLLAELGCATRPLRSSEGLSFLIVHDICYNNVIEERNDMKLKTRMRVNENGRVVIPASFRKRLGIRVGDEVVLQIQDDELRITTLKRNIERAQRLVRKHVKPGTSLVDELIAERHEAARNE
jgi:antitoxin PrlF